MLQCSRVLQHPHTHQAPAIYGNITLASSACSYACAVIGMHQFCMFHCWHKASLLQQLQLLTPPQPNTNSRGTVTVHTDKPDDAITIILTVQNDSKSAHHFEASTFPSAATHGHLITSDTWVEHFNTICTQEAGIWTNQPSEVQMSGGKIFHTEKKFNTWYSLCLCWQTTSSQAGFGFSAMLGKKSCMAL